MRKENEFHDVELDVVQNELKVLRNFKLFFEREDYQNNDLVWVGGGDEGCMTGDRGCESGGYYVSPQEAERLAYESALKSQVDEYNSNLVYDKDSEGMYEHNNRQHVWEYRHTREDLLAEMKGLAPTGTDERFMAAYAHLNADKHENVYARTYTAPRRDREGQYEGPGTLGWKLVDSPSMREMEGYKSYVNVANDRYSSAKGNYETQKEALLIGPAPGSIVGVGGARRSSAGPRQVRMA